MPHTKLLDSAEVTLQTLRDAVNLRVVLDDGYAIVSGSAQRELLRVPVSGVSGDTLSLWFFLEGNAFSDVDDEEEVYACLIIDKPEPLEEKEMSAAELEATYERIIRSLPDFDENESGRWYLAVEFADDTQFAFVEFMPDDPGHKWGWSSIHNAFVDHSW